MHPEGLLAQRLADLGRYTRTQIVEIGLHERIAAHIHRIERMRRHPTGVRSVVFVWTTVIVPIDDSVRVALVQLCREVRYGVDEFVIAPVDVAPEIHRIHVDLLLQLEPGFFPKLLATIVAMTPPDPTLTGVGMSAPVHVVEEYAVEIQLIERLAQ